MPPDDDGDGEAYLGLHFPNGRRTRRLALNSKGRRATLLKTFRFEPIRFLGDYEAMWNSDTGEIEAARSD